MDGVKNQYELPPPVENDPSALSADEMIKHGVERFPETLYEALIELEEDPFLMETLGTDLANTYIAVKTSECGAFAGANVDFEMAYHRNKF
jgi:glutamine synthetase